MKENKEKRKCYFLIAAALIVGAMIGYFATNALSTTGDAKNTLHNKFNPLTEYTSKITLENGDTQYNIVTDASGSVMNYKDIANETGCSCHVGICKCGGRCESTKHDEYGLTYEITTSNCGPVIKKNVNNVPEQN